MSSKPNPFESIDRPNPTIAEQSQGKVKKNWKGIIGIFGLCVLVIVIWLLPDATKKEVKKATTTEQIDPKKTAELIINQATGDATERANPSPNNNGKNELKKGDVPAAPIPNGNLTTSQVVVTGSTETKSGTSTFTNQKTTSGANAPVGSYTNGAGDGNNKPNPEQEAQKRREEVWASAIDAKGVKTKKESSNGASGNGLAPANLFNPMTSAAQAMAANSAQQAQNSLNNLNDPVKQAAQINELTKSQNQPAAQISKANQDANWLLNQSNGNKILPIINDEPPPYGTVIQQGTLIRGVLLSGINTDLPGNIEARVVSNVYDSINQTSLLIPKGSRLIGVYNHDIVVGQSRVLVAFTRLIRPDGSSIALSGAPGTDMQGVGGFSGEVNNHFFKIFSTAAVIGAASALSGGQNVTVTQGLSGTQVGGNVMAQALSEAVQISLQRNRNIAPTITKGPGEEFMFVTTRDMRLSQILQ